jgi:4-amino-4-deoxy-L-arabinose transferase-like glycosyltransferase
LSFRTWTIAAVSAIALFFLYFFGLARSGMLGPDEPRYAAIGREMARSGDWITPRLNDKPWFEKPALLYWMTAAGFKAGLDDDLAPRLPVAIVSVSFLIFYFFLLRRELGLKPAAFSTCILATSAGWLAYSHIAVTDLPMSAAFAAAMFLVQAGFVIPAGICLGLAILGKGLVPLVLFLPAVWFFRRKAFIALGIGILVALPWYALVTARNGSDFLYQFFWVQHFSRFTTGALMHVRPFWFFVPVLLAGLFPWTPVLALLFRRGLYCDRRVQFRMAGFVFGFLFFSLSQNKLPGYLLPLLPLLTAVCGLALAQVRKAGPVLALSALLLWLVPTIERSLPQALISGASHTRFDLPYGFLTPVLCLALICFFGRRQFAIGIVAICITVAVARIIWITYPLLDRTVSARAYYRARPAGEICNPDPNRSWRYGLDYYAHREIPDCK